MLMDRLLLPLLLITSIILTLPVFTTTAQTTLPYNDDFTGEDGKGNIGGTEDVFGVDWSINTTSANIASGDVFGVQSEVFEVVDIDGDAIWTSESIDISGESNLDFSIDALADGDFEASGDIFIIELIVDGGSPTTLFEGTVDEAISGDPMFFGSTQLNTSLQTFSKSVAVSGSTAEIKITANNNADSETFGFDNLSLSIATIKAEPANHATNFNATPSSFNQVDVSWTDATGTPAPDNYLVKVNTGAITVPSDGTPEPDDTDFSDGAGVVNIAEGTESASISGLDPNTTYNFEIYPYTNSGSIIDYKTDGTVPSASATTDEAPNIVINEILADPDATKGDANGDGTVSSDDDEFVEIVNSGVTELDISGWVIADGSDDKFTFPNSTILQPNQPAVVFGGGTPTGYFGGALVFTTGSLGFNNGGDDVIVKNTSGAVVVSVTYGSEGGNDEALTRDPDLTGSFVQHTSITGVTASFSPGAKNDGTNFGNFVNLTGSQGFRLLSIPTANTSFANLVDPLWTQGMTGADDEQTASPDNLWTWDNNSTDNASTNWNAASDLSTQPAAGTGFLMFVFEDNDGNTAGIQNAFPKSLSMSGTENNGPVNPAVNSNPGGFTLLGNPFASSIDIDVVSKTDINAAYVWDPNDGASGNWFSRTFAPSPRVNLVGLFPHFKVFLLKIQLHFLVSPR